MQNWREVKSEGPIEIGKSFWSVLSLALIYTVTESWSFSTILAAFSSPGTTRVTSYETKIRGRFSLINPAIADVTVAWAGPAGA